MTYAEILVTFDDFAARLPSVNRRTWERLSARGEAPQGVRLTPKSRPLYRLADVDRWIASKMAVLDGAGQ